MADSWKTSRTRQAHAAVKAERKMHQIAPWPDGPWDEAGNLRLPAWLEGAPPMPFDWPLTEFYIQVGKMTLGVYR